MRRCELLIGRIISHPCSLKAKTRCGTCNRTTCAGHLSQDAAFIGICVQCAGSYAPPDGVRRISFAEMFEFDEADFDAFVLQQAQVGADDHHFDS